MEKKIPEILSEKKIVQKLAGYKSNYVKKYNLCKTSAERRKMIAGASEYIEEKRQMLLEQNKKAKQILAGYKSWETRRNNLEKINKENKSNKNNKNDSYKISRKYNSRVYDGDCSFKM